jgi:hypothetical protein
VDGLLQPGAYHGLPIEMPMEAHQTILAANGVAEANDAARRAAKGKGRKLGVLLESAPADKAPSTGERVVAGAAEAMRAAGGHVQRTGSSFVRWALVRNRPQ